MGWCWSRGGRAAATLTSAELYNVGLGFSSAWQPQIAPFTLPLSLGSSLVLTGSQFRGISEGSGGNNCQDSPGDYPVVQLESLGNEQTMFLQSTAWSTNSFISAPVNNFPPGYSLATVFVNGIPSAASILDIVATGSPLPNHVDHPHQQRRGWQQRHPDHVEHERRRRTTMCRSPRAR